jgi:hypothetical protein
VSEHFELVELTRPLSGGQQMAREDSSVMSSLQQLMADQEQRRTEQIVLSHRRKLEQDREQLEQEARRAELAQRRAEDAKHEVLQRAAQQRAEQERLERDRAFELERVRGELALRAKATVMEIEQQQELARLAIVRDARLAQVEGQRLVLGAMLGTLVVGSALLYALVLRPEAQRQGQVIEQLGQANAEQRSGHERERSQLAERIAELESQLTSTQIALEKSLRHAPTSEPKPAHAPKATRSVPAPPPPCVDDNDPLCGNLNRR